MNTEPDSPDPLAGPRGIHNACLLSLPLWIALAICVLLVLKLGFGFIRTDVFRVCLGLGLIALVISGMNAVKFLSVKQ